MKFPLNQLTTVSLPDTVTMYCYRMSFISKRNNFPCYIPRSESTFSYSAGAGICAGGEIGETVGMVSWPCATHAVLVVVSEGVTSCAAVKKVDSARDCGVNGVCGDTVALEPSRNVFTISKACGSLSLSSRTLFYKMEGYSRGRMRLIRDT